MPRYASGEPVPHGGNRKVRSGANAARAEPLSAQCQNLGNRSRGLYAAVGSRLRREEEVADRKLLARVRSTLGHHVSNPRAIEVEVCDGLVTLTGAVLAEELDGMLAAVAAVKGVKGVVNQLVAHECAETLPALASGGSRRRSLPPAARLLAGTAGGVLALAALKQRNPVGAALGSVGLGLLATSGLAGRNLRGLDLGALAAPAQT